MWRIVLLLALAGCLREPRLIRLREEAIPWPLGKPYEGRAPAEGALVMRFDLPEAEHEVIIDCTTAAGGVEMSIYAGGKEALSHGPCRPVILRDLAPGAYFVLVRPGTAAADVTVEAAPRQH